MCSLTLETLNLMAASLHAIQAVLVIGLTVWLNTRTLTPNTSGSVFNSGHFDLTRTIRVINSNYSITHEYVTSGSLDVRYLMIAFFTLSACFQAFASFMGTVGLRSNNIIRFLEYSISASLVMLALAVEAGITDVYTIECMFVLIWATQILGIAAEYLQTPQDPWSCLYIHAAGWITFLSAYAPVIDAFLLSVANSTIKPPDFVYPLIILEFILFAIFGCVQTYLLVYSAITAPPLGGGSYSRVQQAGQLGLFEGAEPPLNTDVQQQAEFFYIILSFTAKTLLCWIILAPILNAA